MVPECRTRFFTDYFFAPKTKVGQRIVTAHDNLHPLNMLQLPEGLRCIDFEFTCVGNTIQDLSYVFAWVDGNWFGDQKAQKKTREKKGLPEGIFAGHGGAFGHEGTGGPLAGRATQCVRAPQRSPGSMELPRAKGIRPREERF